MDGLVVRAMAVWLLIALGEILNGNLRVRYLHGRYGKYWARKISFFTGLTIIYVICWFTLPWLSPSNLQDCFLIGLVWMILMVCLDIYVGRYIFHLQWMKILEDFDLRKGNLLGAGMGLIFLCPATIYVLT